jgi:hypothetical protein
MMSHIVAIRVGRLRWLAAVVILGASGCGNSVKLVPASGVVLINGKPAAGISVQFLPEDVKGEKRPTSFALTDDEGKFVLQTYQGKDGAVPGPHIVLLADTLEDRPPQGQTAKMKSRLSGGHATVSGGLKMMVPESSEPMTVKVGGTD